MPGGDSNFAQGDRSYAAGHRAQALHAGAFVWADSQSGSYASDRDNQLKIRAGGGVIMDVSGSSGLNPAALRINSTSANGVALYASQSSSDATLAVNNAGTGDIVKGFNGGGSPVFEVVHDGTVYSQGVVLTSDRNAKENFRPLDVQAVLDKVATLPLSIWSFKGDRGARHLGPVAQDFHAAFGLNGTDDRHISVGDEGGVALAAIQGLNQKVAEQCARLEQKQTEITALRSELTELKELVRNLRQKLDEGATRGQNGTLVERRLLLR